MIGFREWSDYSHVHTIHSQDKPSKESGNLYLSGVAAFKDKKLK